MKYKSPRQGVMSHYNKFGVSTNVVLEYRQKRDEMPIGTGNRTQAEIEKNIPMGKLQQRSKELYYGTRST